METLPNSLPERDEEMGSVKLTHSEPVEIETAFSLDRIAELRECERI